MNAELEYLDSVQYLSTDLQEYRQSPRERQRAADLLSLIRRGRDSVLDIGARDGFFSRLLTGYFNSVTALDLTRPEFEFERVRTVAGDITNLPFADSSVDCVFCAEVLEHIPDLEKACRELARVARHEIIIGVPYRQDIRIGRTTCRACAGISPPWGHVNTFDEARLISLFPTLRLVRTSFVGVNSEATSAAATWLMDRAGNPWGTYDQDEGCVQCGEPIIPPDSRRPLSSRLFSGAAFLLNSIQRKFHRPHPNWIHMVFAKEVRPAHVVQTWGRTQGVVIRHKRLPRREPSSDRELEILARRVSEYAEMGKQHPLARPPAASERPSSSSAA